MAATTSSGRSPTFASARLSTMMRVSFGLEHVERLDRDAQVLHGQDVEGRDEHEGAADVAGREDVLGERGQRVDDDVVVVLARPP